MSHNPFFNITELTTRYDEECAKVALHADRDRMAWAMEWQARTQLAIAQQLSVMSATLKKIESMLVEIYAKG